MGPTRKFDYDAIVVGGGVVGLACLHALAQRGMRPLLVERHGSFGQETSSRNSEVIHAGLYYPPGSRKARYCVAGRRLLYEWCKVHGVAHAMCGKYVVGGAEEDEEALRRILATGRENGAEDLALVSGEELARREPRVKAHVALFSPRTGIVDSHGFMASLLAEARRAGSDVAFRHRLLGVARVGGGYELAVAAGGDSPTTVSAPRVVNAAGLESDTVAALAGIDVDAAGYRLVYVKGHYFRLRRAGLASSLIYPVPQPKLLGLGIHLTLDLGGGARLGPDTEVLPDRHVDYRVPEALSTKFWEAARRYLPELQPDDLVPDQSGLRPRLARPQGAVPDFVVEEEAARGLPGWVNLVGIESPGLTSALAIANDVVALVE